MRTGTTSTQVFLISWGHVFDERGSFAAVCGSFAALRPGMTTSISVKGRALILATLATLVVICDRQAGMVMFYQLYISRLVDSRYPLNQRHERLLIFELCR